MNYDIWQREREAADVLPFGLRVRRTDSPKPTAAIWRPKAFKPAAFYAFRTVEAREAYIEKFVAAYGEEMDSKTARRAESRTRSQEHSAAIQVGHIFRYSWGYDQTNVDYYQVIAKHGQNVTVQAIAQSAVPGSAGFMCERVEPRIGLFLRDEKPFTKRVQFTNDGRAYLSFDFGWCELWRGGSAYQSHYA